MYEFDHGVVGGGYIPDCPVCGGAGRFAPDTVEGIQFDCGHFVGVFYDWYSEEDEINDLAVLSAASVRAVRQYRIGPTEYFFAGSGDLVANRLAFAGWQAVLDGGYLQPANLPDPASLISWAIERFSVAHERLIVDPGQGVVTTATGAVLARVSGGAAPSDIVAELRYQARALGIDYDRVDRPDHSSLFVLAGRL